jgi:hypothetical protein
MGRSCIGSFLDARLSNEVVESGHQLLNSFASDVKSKQLANFKPFKINALVAKYFFDK